MKSVTLISLLMTCCLTSKIVEADVSYFSAEKITTGSIPSIKIPKIKIFGKIGQDDVQRFQFLNEVAIQDIKNIGISKIPGNAPFVVSLVGIHRPFIEDDNAFTVNDQKQNYLAIEKYIKDYLSFVNVPTSLYDTMFRIPPEKVRFLSASELQDYNLNEDDPYYKAAEDSANAKKAGLSTSEYLRKRRECEDSPNEYKMTECFLELFKH